MATREKVALETHAVVAKCGDLKTIFDAIKDAGDRTVYLDNNENLPVVVRAAEKDVFRANFDRIKEEVKAIVAAW